MVQNIKMRPECDKERQSNKKNKSPNLVSPEQEQLSSQTLYG